MCVYERERKRVRGTDNAHLCSDEYHICEDEREHHQLVMFDCHTGTLAKREGVCEGRENERMDRRGEG